LGRAFCAAGVGVAQCDKALDVQTSQRLENPADTILIVEDNELNMKLFHDLLAAHGYKVLQAFDGQAGLQLAQQHHPDLIIMDVQLPGNLSGLEVTQVIKDDPELKEIPVIAVTAFAMKGDEVKVRAAGCDGYITKPISALNFLQSIKQYLCERRSAS
jgi:two-component system cell cycle response regulator DivK